MVLKLEQIGVMLDEFDLDQPDLQRSAAVRFARAVERATILAVAEEFKRNAEGKRTFIRQDSATEHWAKMYSYVVRQIEVMGVE